MNDSGFARWLPLLLRRGKISLILLLFTALNVALPNRARADNSVYWTPGPKGVEFARVPAFGAAARPGNTILLARIDPAAVLFRVYYRGGKAKIVQDWIKEFPSAALIVNANFYRSRGRPLGLVMIDNKLVSHPSGRPGAGNFQVKGEIPQVGPLSVEQVLSNQEVSEYTEAFEGYPLLIDKGQPIPTMVEYDARIRARRTIIAQDGEGRILIVVTTPIEVTLAEMTNWLLVSGLNVSSALNLDGGFSSQMLIPSSGDQPELASGIVGVPVVLVIYTR